MVLRSKGYHFWKQLSLQHHCREHKPKRSQFNCRCNMLPVCISRRRPRPVGRDFPPSISAIFADSICPTMRSLSPTQQNPTQEVKRSCQHFCQANPSICKRTCKAADQHHQRIFRATHSSLTVEKKSHHCTHPEINPCLNRQSAPNCTNFSLLQDCRTFHSTWNHGSIQAHPGHCPI